MPKARLHFDGDNTWIEKEARLYSLTQTVENKLDSISTIETTLQWEIDDLQNQINQVASRGRYLTTWDCTTWLPDTNPTTDPYVYRAWDYYIISTVGGTNYRPHGSEYHAWVASQTLETQAVSANDLYIYDGTQWTLQRTWASVFAVWWSIAWNLAAQTDLQNALNAKANAADLNTKTFYISQTWSSSQTLQEAQAAYDYWLTWWNPIITIDDGSDDWYYLLTNVSNTEAVFSSPNLDKSTQSWHTLVIKPWIIFTLSSNSVTNVSSHSLTQYNYIDTNTTYSGAFTPTADYHPATKKYVDDNDTYIWASAPTSNLIEWRAWYDTANDVLKVYDWTNWNVCWWSSYTAWDHIFIDNDTISATWVQDTLVVWDNITLSPNMESDMKWPSPSWYHIPTYNEWNDLISIIKNTFSLPNVDATMWTYLKMPSAGCRRYLDTSVYEQGTAGHYLASTWWFSSSYWYDSIYFRSNAIGASRYGSLPMAYSIRPAKNIPIVPDSSWTTLYDWSAIATWAWIFHNTTDWLISISWDWVTWITIADKNLWATTVYNSWDALSEANCGWYFQWWNNYMFPFTWWTIETTNTKVDASNYWPWNYYNSSKFYIYVDSRESSNNYNLWWWVTQSTHKEWEIISTEANTKIFQLSWTSWATALAEAQDIYDWYLWGNTPLLVYNNYTYVLSSVASDKIWFKWEITQQNQNSSSFTWQDVIYLNFNVNDEVTSITTDTAVVAWSYLRLGQNYNTPYTPVNDWDPTSKKYVDEHWPNIPVYSYHWDFSTSVSCDVVVWWDYKIVVTWHHGSTIDRDVVVTVDWSQAASYTSNVIENFCYVCVVTATWGAWSSIVITKTSNTSFTIYDVYIEKINIQSGYLTATVN